MADQQFCLRWKNHQNTLISVFDTLLEGEILVDCTLAAEGKFLRAHKVVLSACSPFFNDLLRQHYEKHPILIMKDVKFDQLKAMLDYMYRGEVNISQDKLGNFLKAAESLQIKGLSDNPQNHDLPSKPKESAESGTTRLPSKPEDDLSPPKNRNTSPTRKRKRRRLRSASSPESIENDISSEHALDSSAPQPGKTSSNSRLSNPPSPQVSTFSCRDGEAATAEEASGSLTNRPLSVATSVILNKGDLGQLQSTPFVSSELYEPKAEFIELDEEEDFTIDEENREAGPSHSNDSGGYNWQVDRPEDSFLSQDSLGGHRNAQGSTLIGARTKLASSLQGLSQTLLLAEQFNESSSPVLNGLAQNIDYAIKNLHDPRLRQPLYNGCQTQARQKLIFVPVPKRFNSKVIATPLLNCNGFKEEIHANVPKTVKRKMPRPGPKSKKSFSVQAKKVFKQKRTKLAPPSPDSLLYHLKLDVDLKNKIWLEPEIVLHDVLKRHVVEDEAKQVQCNGFSNH